MLGDSSVYLRRLEATDLDRTWEWINTPEIYLAIGTNAPVSKTAQVRWFEALDRASDKIVFAVCLRDDNRHIGNISLDSIELRHRHARLSIFLADSTCRGKGFGTRAMTLLLNYAFGLLNLHRVFLKVSAERADAVRFYQRIGFRTEGLLREHEFLNGRYSDKQMLGILRSEWETRPRRD